MERVAAGVRLPPAPSTRPRGRCFPWEDRRRGEGIGKLWGWGPKGCWAGQSADEAHPLAWDGIDVKLAAWVVGCTPITPEERALAPADLQQARELLLGPPGRRDEQWGRDVLDLDILRRIAQEPRPSRPPPPLSEHAAAIRALPWLPPSGLDGLLVVRWATYQLAELQGLSEQLQAAFVLPPDKLHNRKNTRIERLCLRWKEELPVQMRPTILHAIQLTNWVMDGWIDFCNAVDTAYTKYGVRAVRQHLMGARGIAERLCPLRGLAHVLTDPVQYTGLDNIVRLSSPAHLPALARNRVVPRAPATSTRAAALALHITGSTATAPQRMIAQGNTNVAFHAALHAALYRRKGRRKGAAADAAALAAAEAAAEAAAAASGIRTAASDTGSPANAATEFSDSSSDEEEGGGAVPPPLLQGVSAARSVANEQRGRAMRAGGLVSLLPGDLMRYRTSLRLVRGDLLLLQRANDPTHWAPPARPVREPSVNRNVLLALLGSDEGVSQARSDGKEAQPPVQRRAGKRAGASQRGKAGEASGSCRRSRNPDFRDGFRDMGATLCPILAAANNQCCLSSKWLHKALAAEPTAVPALAQIVAEVLLNVQEPGGTVVSSFTVRRWVYRVLLRPVTLPGVGKDRKAHVDPRMAWLVAHPIIVTHCARESVRFAVKRNPGLHRVLRQRQQWDRSAAAARKMADIMRLRLRSTCRSWTRVDGQGAESFSQKLADDLVVLCRYVGIEALNLTPAAVRRRRSMHERAESVSPGVDARGYGLYAIEEILGRQSMGDVVPQHNWRGKQEPFLRLLWTTMRNIRASRATGNTPPARSDRSAGAWRHRPLRAHYDKEALSPWELGTPLDGDPGTRDHWPGGDHNLLIVHLLRRLPGLQLEGLSLNIMCVFGMSMPALMTLRDLRQQYYSKTRKPQLVQLSELDAYDAEALWALLDAVHSRVAVLQYPVCTTTAKEQDRHSKVVLADQCAFWGHLPPHTGYVYVCPRCGPATSVADFHSPDAGSGARGEGPTIFGVTGAIHDTYTQHLYCAPQRTVSLKMRTTVDEIRDAARPSLPYMSIPDAVAAGSEQLRQRAASVPLSVAKQVTRQLAKERRHACQTTPLRYYTLRGQALLLQTKDGERTLQLCSSCAMVPIYYEPQALYGDPRFVTCVNCTVRRVMLDRHHFLRYGPPGGNQNAGGGLFGVVRCCCCQQWHMASRCTYVVVLVSVKEGGAQRLPLCIGCGVTDIAFWKYGAHHNGPRGTPPQLWTLSELRERLCRLAGSRGGTGRGKYTTRDVLTRPRPVNLLSAHDRLYNIGLLGRTRLYQRKRLAGRRDSSRG